MTSDSASMATSRWMARQDGGATHLIAMQAHPANRPGCKFHPTTMGHPDAGRSPRRHRKVSTTSREPGSALV